MSLRKMMVGLCCLTIWATWCLAAVPTYAEGKKEHFCIAKDGKAATVVVDKKDWPSVARAANDLREDIRRVMIPLSSLEGDTHAGKPADSSNETSILVGTIGKSRIIYKLVKDGKIDVSGVSGQWEAFVIDEADGNLVVAGSDKRGTIYGIYEVSRRIGVSPWYWWADVPVDRKAEVYWDAGRLVQCSPKVRYRGIFINDEDWGLQPWAAKNYERRLGDIGPKTYARVCELLLRLRANMLAPAMHSCTGAFYSYPESKVVADSFGIIITTSHCEPLLLNNAAESEWDQQRDGDWNYKTNRETIFKKWDDRLKEAARYENIYTMAMRGIHDAGLRGNLPMEERVPLIEQVIKDQRGLLSKHRADRPHATNAIPQIFVPYKETMDIYEAGLRVPDDITLVWVDDNYGYMKRVSSPEEQQRSGRSGVYYHLSYLGAPHDYLWLNTTPPVLMYEELKKAYDTGADRYWLLNVGDIKPMELGIQTFMDLAWDMDDEKESGTDGFAAKAARVNRHQAKMLAGIFGNELEETFQSMLDDYYRLAWSRKPEFMGFEYEWDDKAHEGLKPTEYSFRHYAEAQRRLRDYERLSVMAEMLGDQVEGKREAFYELLQFPIQASCQMNRKFLMAQLNHELLADGREAEANWAARQAQQAFDSIQTLNRRYNEQLNGKWRGMMTIPPGYCALYHQMPEVTYTEGVGEQAPDLTPACTTAGDGCHVVSLPCYEQKSRGISLMDGLGYDGAVVRMQGGNIRYMLPPITADTVSVVVYTVPFWPLYKGKSNRVGVSIDGGHQQVFENKFKEYDRTWKDQVMRNGAVSRMRFAIDKTKGDHTLTLHTVDEGQMVQRVIVDWGGLKPSYIGPTENRW